MLSDEANLIDILQTLRYLQSGLDYLISPEKKTELRVKNKLRDVPDEIDDHSGDEVELSKVDKQDKDGG